MITASRKPISLLITLFATAVILGISYYELIAPQYSYMGFRRVAPDLWQTVFTAFCFLLAAFFLPVDFDKPSRVFVVFIFTIVILPTMVMSNLVLTEVSPLQFMLVNLLLTASFIIIAYFSEARIVSNTLVSVKTWQYLIILLGVAGLVGFFLYLDYGFNLSQLFSLDDLVGLYDIRLSHREEQQGASVVSLYGQNWLAKVIVPSLLAYGIYKRSAIFIVSAFALQIYLFTFGAQKSYLLTMIMAIGIILVILNRTEEVFRFYSYLFAFILVSYLLWVFADFSLPMDVLVRRALHVPGMLTNYYFEHFSQNGQAWYSHHFLAGITDSGYAKSPEFIIGEQYIGRTETRANANYFADAYANVGILGVLFVSVILGLILNAINIVSQDRPKILVFGAIVGIAWAVSESSLSTVILTHGLIFSLFLINFIPKERE